MGKKESCNNTIEYRNASLFSIYSACTHYLSTQSYALNG